MDGRRRPQVSRRALLTGLVAGGVAGCAGDPAAPGPHGSGGGFPTPTRLTPSAGQRVVTRTLTAGPATVDLGGVTVETWAYDGQVPGPVIRARAGDLVRVDVRNALPDETTVHWHGIRLRNAADGVPGLTQDPIAPGATFGYEYSAPDPGTYFYHPHVGVQLDRGLYAPLLIDDPAEPGDYDAEWVVVLDDWIDGTGTTPDEVLAELLASGGMGGMGHGGMGHGGMGGDPLGGDVDHPYFLANGRLPTDPDVLRARPGQRVRIRIVNAASDTIFAVALGGHRLRITHSDGFPVRPRDVDGLFVGMGERYDAVVTLGDGVFPLVAEPQGKDGQAVALVRTGGGAVPGVPVRPRELDGEVVLGASLAPAEQATLPVAEPDDLLVARLSGGMMGYDWAINDGPYGENTPLTVGAGRRVRLRILNQSMMTHPMHLHGHTFALPGGLRKDTVLVAPMRSLEVDFDTDNPGRWMTHCHNLYHAEAGMMIELRYAT